MYETGIIVDKVLENDKLILQIVIPNGDTKEHLLERNGNTCGLWFDDNRNISVEQRKKIYATLADIAEFTGYMPDETKQLMKFRFVVESGIEEFSLSNCSMQTASDFIDYLIDFCFAENIPLSDSGIHRTSNLNKYLFLCLKHKKCCICGEPADTHHEDAIGMGADRTQVDDSEYKKMALCRIHHTERHTIGEKLFSGKYHVYGIKYEEPKKLYIPISSFMELENIA